MKVQALINFKDRLTGKEITSGKVIDIEDENRLKELLGENKDKIVAVKILEDGNTDPEETKNPEAETTEETEETKTESENKPRTVNQKGNKKNAKK